MKPSTLRRLRAYTAKAGDLVRVQSNGVVAVLKSPERGNKDCWNVVILVGNGYWKPGDKATANRPDSNLTWNYPWTDELRLRYIALRLEGKA